LAVGITSVPWQQKAWKQTIRKQIDTKQETRNKDPAEQDGSVGFSYWLVGWLVD